jgi:DNA-directed DNA polymerase III PolC
LDLAPLLCRSAYTFYSGVLHPEEIVETAKALGFRAAGIADRDGLYGAVKFYKYAKKHNIKPVIGVELTHPKGEGSVFLIAKNMTGYGSIAKLVTRRKLRPDEMDLVREAAEESKLEGLFILSSSPALLYLLIKEGALREFLFIRLSGTKEEDSEAEKAKLLLDLPFAFAPLFAFSRKEEWFTHKFLRAAKHLQPELSPGNTLLAGKELEEKFGSIGEAVSNTSKIIDGSNLELPLHELLLPHPPLKSGENSDEKLKALSYAGLARRNRKITHDYIKRLSSELDTICSLGFAGYFLLVKEIASFSIEMGFPYLGRGSGASSLVSYCLGLTHVDPVKHNLYFERFLNPERKNLPDIDLDFSSADRDFVIDRVIKQYGEEHVAMISTHNTFSARSAFREMAKALGVPEEEISAVARALPHSSVEQLKNSLKQKPEAKKIEWKDGPWLKVLSMAKKVDGLPRHLSVHCGGIVVAPIELTQRTALERSAKGVPITQYDMFDIEDLGLVKIDLLGNRSLALLTEAAATIKEETGALPPVFPPEKTFEDPKTVRLISSGNTMGCFYIESPGMRQLLQRLNTRTFEELTAASSIIRPGVAESGMMAAYIKRSRGEEKVEYLHPGLEKLLSETFGVMVYQEDVLKVVHEFAGLSLGEADLIRRAMSGKHRCAGEMEKLSKKFFESGRGRGINDHVLSRLWDQVRSFAGYAFCKAHSASFAQLSFQCTYLKAHYREHFFPALINNCGGFYPTSAYIEEARRCGMKILPPDVNLSDDVFRGKGDDLRSGFFVLKGVQRRLIERLYEERGEGPFVSFSDLLARLDGGFKVKEIETLILSGALDSFGPHRGHLLSLLRLSEGNAKKAKEMEKKGINPSYYPPKVTPSLPRALHFAQEAKQNDRPFGPLSLSELLEGERFALGFCPTAHPLTPMLPWAERSNLILARNLNNHEGQKVSLFGQVVTYKRLPTKKTGEGMAFVTLEDPTGLMELVFFPKAYTNFGALITQGFPIKAEGIIGRADEGLPITINSAAILPAMRLPKPVEWKEEVA